MLPPQLPPPLPEINIMQAQRAIESFEYSINAFALRPRSLIGSVSGLDLPERLYAWVAGVAPASPSDSFLLFSELRSVYVEWDISALNAVVPGTFILTPTILCQDVFLPAGIAMPSVAVTINAAIARFGSQGYITAFAPMPDITVYFGTHWKNRTEI